MSAAALAAGNAVMVPQKQLEAMAKTSGLSVEAMNQQAIAALYSGRIDGTIGRYPQGR